MSQKVRDKIRTKTISEETIPSFIRKTYDFLEEGNYHDIISWSDDGTSIVIKNPTEFSQKVLPIYFKHNNLTSFVRQLNMYDFHKKRSMNMDHVYCHELFQKGKPHLLKDIKRKNSDNSMTIEKSMGTFENNQAKQDLAAVVHENVILKKLNQETLARVCILESKIKELTIQNQALWNQIYQQHEKAEALKTFITGVIKQHGINSSNLPQNLRTEIKLSPIHQMQETLNSNSPTLLAQTSTKLFANENAMNLEFMSSFNNDKTMNFDSTPKSNNPSSFMFGQQTQHHQKNNWNFDFEFLKFSSQANNKFNKNTDSEKNSEEESFEEENFEEEKSNSKKKGFEKPKQTRTKNIHKLDDKHYYQKIDRVPLKKTIIDGENNERLRVCKTEDGIEDDEDPNLTPYSSDFSPVQIVEIKNEGLN